MAWEMVRKIGKSAGLNVGLGECIERRQSVEIGYAWRFMSECRIAFYGASAPDGPSVPRGFAESSSPFPLPGTLGSYPAPSPTDLPSGVLLEEVAGSITQVLKDRSRGRIKLLAADLQAGAASWCLSNSRGANVDWGGTIFSALLNLETPAGRLSLPLAARDIHRFRVEHVCACLEPYFQLPLPERAVSSGRRPAAWSALTAAFFLARLGERLKNGFACPRLPEGFLLCDDPLHPEGLAWVPVDGEGRKTSCLSMAGARIADGTAAMDLGLPPTGHALRISVFDPPTAGYHNLFLTGPPGALPGASPILVLTAPLRMDWLEGDRFALHAQGFTWLRGAPSAFHPCICVRSTVQDVISSLEATLPPLRFFPFGGSTGSPGLLFKGINIFT